MQTDITINVFEPGAYLESLMEDIGFKDASENERAQMSEALSEQVNYLILNAITLYVEPEQIDETLINSGDLEDLATFIEKLVEISPEAQYAIIEALDRFYTETVETYDSFKNPQ
ncbi:hypothetical protein KKA33_01700 [Patescibacteria group bacterium]|nr:hypothetical protein [Patescibacteria group bacterium]